MKIILPFLLSTLTNCLNYKFSMAEGFQFDYVFDWTILKYQQSQMATPLTRALVSDPQWPLVFSTYAKK